MKKKLSPKQLSILNKNGKFIVNACAGSGKTFTLSKKLAKLIENNDNLNQGVATLSFTNSAWKEIKKNFDEWGLEIKSPNFIGTFDRFINKYIFYQYYYLLDEFDKRPLLVGDLGTPWRGGHYELDYYNFFDIFSFDENDNLIKTKDIRIPFKIKTKNTDGSINGHYKNIVNMKYDCYKKGFVTQADINYFSLKLITDFEFISEIIANKFPIFLIDESQDTNSMKMRIMEIILNNRSIEEFIFIGDFNQAIYEWNGANPEIFLELMEKYDTIDLDENWRSSQNICDFASKLSKKNYIAVNDDVKDFPFKPVIFGYDEPKENKSDFFNNEIINYFLKICDENGIKINKTDVAVLCKGNAMINTINGQNYFNFDKLFGKDNVTYDFIFSRFLFDQGNLNESYLKLEPSLIPIILDKPYVSLKNKNEYIDEIGFFNMRKLCLDLLNYMPPSDNISVKNWVNALKLKLENSDFIFKNRLLDKINVNDGYNILIEDLFYHEDVCANYHLNTIHGVKAKTFDAVLLILRTKTDKGSYEGMVAKFLDSGKIVEDLRNVYVAITRPRKILVMAVPKNHEKMWYELFFDEGYREKGQSSLFEF